MFVLVSVPIVVSVFHRSEVFILLLIRPVLVWISSTKASVALLKVVSVCGLSIEWKQENERDEKRIENYHPEIYQEIVETRKKREKQKTKKRKHG